MKHLVKRIGYTIVAVIIIVIAVSCGSNKQEIKLEVLPAKPPFWNDIQSFKKQDSFSFPQDSAILFIGSSSFTMWQDVQDYFPGFTIINRGFGGSTLQDQIRYANDIIFPYNPKQIIIYCGENDFAWDSTVTVATIFARFKELFQIIRQNLMIYLLLISL